MDSNNNVYDPNKYDPTLIIESAQAKLKSNDLEGGQLVFQTALLDWVDDARETQNFQLKEAVATLWLAYAHFLASAKQFKSATEAYDQAIACPVAGSVGRIYLDFARFAVERNKPRKAQDVYMKALVGSDGQLAAVEDEQDKELLWQEFLSMMQESNPSLTMDSLRQAVQAEHAQLEVPSAVLSDEGSLPAKRLKTEHNTTQTSKTHVITRDEVEAQAQQLVQSLQQTSPDIAAAWMLRDGHGPPTVPSTLFQARPPKLGDPTGKDMLGAQHALALNKRMLEPSGGLLLQVCRGLWTLHGMTEQHAWERLESLDKTLTKRYSDLQTTLQERLAVAGPALQAVQQLNQRDEENCILTSQQERQTLLSTIAWEFRTSLCTIQTLLCQLKVPGFEGGPTIDDYMLQKQASVCAILQSAFFVREKLPNAQGHIAMLAKHGKELDQEILNQQEVQELPPPPPTNNSFQQYPPPPPPPPQVYGQPQPQYHHAPPPSQMYGHQPQQYPPAYYH